MITLSAASRPKPQVHDAAAYPRNESRSVGDIDKPSEDSRAAVAAIEVRQKRKDGTGHDCHVWDTIFGTPFKDLGCLLSNRQGVQGS